MRVYFVYTSVLLVIFLLLDFVIFLSLKNNKILPGKIFHRNIFTIVYWCWSLLIMIIMCYFSLIIRKIHEPDVYYRFSQIIFLFLINYIPKLVLAPFLLIISFVKNNKGEKGKHTKISRKQFLGRLGIFIAGIPFVSLLQGYFYGRKNFQPYYTIIPIKNLPKELSGLRIVQISDVHLGNFYHDYESIDKVVKIINHHKPDLFFHTGDMVNNFWIETEGYKTIFRKINARYGKFAILGNHDYGDYSDWPNEKIKKLNFDKICIEIENFGFTLLRNRNTTIEVNSKKIAVIGMENWGNPPFPRYGDLKKSMEGLENVDFKILLSHDPDHWDAEVNGKTDIDLTLSGHTHGMQLGMKFGDKVYSPASIKYKRWAGLYKENSQYLYVNRGLGIIALPVRIGMNPEISIIELKTEYGT